MVKSTLRMMLLMMLMFPIIASSQVLLNQYSHETGIDASQWITLPADATTLLSNSGDSEASSVTDLGFDVLFAGNVYSQFSVNADGLLRLGSTAVSSTLDDGGPFCSGMYENIGYDLPKIAGYGGDGYISGNGYVKCATVGTAPNRTFVVEFKIAEYGFSSDNQLCWQVQFFESSKDIQLVYGPQAVDAEHYPTLIQIGMASSEDDVVIIYVSDNLIDYEPPVYYMDYDWPSPSTYYRFSLPSSCQPPIALTLQSVTETSATIQWDTVNVAYQWEYVCVAEGDSLNWDNSVVAITPDVTLTDLTPNTHYHFHIRTNCDDSTNSVPTQFDFTTHCEPMPLPYIENFDSYTTDVSSSSSRPDTYPNHTLPSCWTFCPMRIDYGGPAIWLTNYPNYSFMEGEYNSIDSISLRFMSGTSQPTYAILPLMEAPITDLQISFQYAMELGTPALTLGVVTNPDDFSTFIPLQTCASTQYVDTIQHIFMYDTVLDASQTYYIAFKMGNGYNKITVLDNIVVDYLPTCITPGYLAVHSASGNEVRLNWRTDADTSQLAYRVAPNGAWSDTIVSDTIATIPNLTELTNYEFKVRAICADGDTSAWSAAIEMRTPCTTRHMPFYEDFTTIIEVSELGCWSFYDVSLDRVLNGTAELVEQDESDCYCYFYPWVMEDANISFDIYGFTYHEWLVTPQIYFNTDARLTFDMALTTYGEVDQGVSGNVDDDRFMVLATTDNGQTWTTLAVWDSAATNPHRYADIPVAPQTITIDMTQFTYQNVRIAFYGESRENGGDNEVHIGHILVSSLGTTTCPIPNQIATTTTASSASIRWSSDATDFEIAIKDSAATSWGDAVVVNDKNYTFTNLLPNHTYSYRICTMCENDIFSDWVEGTFTTDSLTCQPPTFNAPQVDGLAVTLSWNALDENNTYEVHLFGPMIDSSLIVADTHCTFDRLQSVSTYHAVIRTQCSEDSYSEWSDTLEFTTLDCYPVTALAVSDITETTARISWTAGGDEISWIVMYGETDFDDADAVRINVNESSVLLTNLESGISYDVYVRAHCADNFNSIWSTPVLTFQTIEATPEGIDGITGDYQFTIYPNPTHEATTISLTGVDGKVTISVIDINGRSIVTETLDCNSDCEKRMDVSGLSQGTYFVRVLGDSINSLRKLIVR